MSGFDLWKLIFKRYLRLIWVCGVFALLFAVVLFVGFVKDDILSGLYRDIVKNAESDYVAMKCDYSPEMDTGDAEVGIYYTKSGETYDVVIAFGATEIPVDRYGRGLNVCVVLPVWQRYITGGILKTGEDCIWLYRPYATQAGISVGDIVTLSGVAVKNYRVAGTYTADLVAYLKSGFTPSFLIAEGGGQASSSLVCAVGQVYSLFKSELGKNITDDDGMMDLCEGYYLADVGSNALFWLFVVAAGLLQIKMTTLMHNNLARQSFLLWVFGQPKSAQWCHTMCVLMLFGLIALGLSIGIFYAFVGVTETLSRSIMGMVFGEISIGFPVLFSMLGYVVIAAVTQLFCVCKNHAGGGV